MAALVGARAGRPCHSPSRPGRPRRARRRRQSGCGLCRSPVGAGREIRAALTVSAA